MKESEETFLYLSKAAKKIYEKVDEVEQRIIRMKMTFIYKGKLKRK